MPFAYFHLCVWLNALYLPVFAVWHGLQHHAAWYYTWYASSMDEHIIVTTKSCTSNRIREDQLSALPRCLQDRTRDYDIQPCG